MGHGRALQLPSTMALELLAHWQSTDLGFRIAVLSSVAVAYVLFELVIANSLRRSRTA